MEHMTVSAAHQLAPHAIAVNTFRIDVPVASEGFVANLPGADTSDWEPSEVAAEGIVWMLEQPPSYTGHNVGMAELRAEHGIMPSRAARPHSQSPDLVRHTHLRPDRGDQAAARVTVVRATGARRSSPCPGRRRRTWSRGRSARCRRLQAVDQRRHDAGAGHAERMAERDRAAADVELLDRDAEVLRARDHLRRERLVDLEQVDVVGGEVARASAPAGSPRSGRDP